MKKLYLVLLFSIVLFISLFSQASAFCRVEGYNKNGNTAITSNGEGAVLMPAQVTVKCADEVREIVSNTYYLALFGDLTDNCNVCYPLVKITSENNTMHGSISTNSLNTENIFLNISLREGELKESKGKGKTNRLQKNDLSNIPTNLPKNVKTQQEENRKELFSTNEQFDRLSLYSPKKGFFLLDWWYYIINILGIKP